jgi:hypothetical protein
MTIKGGETMTYYNAYLVKAEGIIWKFNNIQKAMDFARTMLTAEGEITVSIKKIKSEEVEV